MVYSTDLRKRVVDFINNGSSKVAAERTFGVSRRTIYNWLEAEDPLACEKPGPKGPRHIDYDALRQMDNASFHKGSETEALIQGCGASLLFSHHIPRS